MNTIKNIAKTAERAINEPTDYLNEVDNLMYCGKWRVDPGSRL